jgi:hypothetical protein
MGTVPFFSWEESVMSRNRETHTETGESFQQRLQRLRLKIDSLPETQRPHLVDLAETIARQAKKETEFGVQDFETLPSRSCTLNPEPLKA